MSAEGSRGLPLAAQGGLLATLTAVAFGVRAARLLGSVHPLGTDGYYYVVQVESLLASGRLHVPDSSWVHGWLAAVAGVTGDPVLGVKLAAVLLAAACVPAAWLLGRALGGGVTGAWVLAGWAAASPTLTHLAGDFPKNLGLVAPLLLVLALLAQPPLDPQPLGRRIGRTLLLVVLALLVATAHRTGAALLLLAAVGAGLGWLGRRLGRGGVPGGSAALRGALLVMGCGLVFSVGTAVLPAWLHPADLARIEGRFALEPHLPGPWGWLGLRPTGFRQVVELSLPWLALGAAAPAWFARPAIRPWLGGLGLALMVLLFPGWRVDELDLGYRLCLLAPFVAMPLGLLLLAPWLPRSRRVSLLLVGVCFALALGSGPGIDPDSSPPYDRYDEVLEAVPEPLPLLLIAHQGMSFYYDHRTGREAMAWAPEPELNRREVYRVVYGVRAGEWLAFAPQDAVLPRPLPLGHGYHYLREDLWEGFLEIVLVEGDEDLQARLDDWRNPRRVRPAYMLRGR